jgi:hypothetical protein
MIRHGKKVGEVFETKDYHIFKPHRLNRVINNNHVNTLTKNMKENGWLPSSCVKVNSKGEITDGHHRLLAAQRAGVPYRYEMVKGTSDTEIRSINRNGKNWAITDHIHGYIVDGNTNYIELKNFMDEFPDIKPTDMMMLTQNSFTAIHRNTMDSGNFKVKDMKIARQWAKNIMELKPIFSEYNRAIFVRALVKIFSKEPRFKFEEFMKKVALRPASLVPCGTVDQYVKLIQDIYNYSRRSDERLYFNF